MGDVDQFDKPASETPDSSPEPSDADDSARSDEAGNGQLAAGQSGTTRTVARRSSLRPAPADYRPSTRDPSTMRPMAVVRAGDAASTDVDDANAPSSRRLDAGATGLVAQAAELAFESTGDRITPLLIPSPPALPIDLVAKTQVHQESLEAAATDDAAAASEPEAQSTDEAVAASQDISPDLTSTRPAESPRVVREPAIVAASATPSSARPARRRYSPIAVFLAGVVVAGAVVAVVPRHSQDGTGRVSEARKSIASKPQQPTASALAQAPKIGGDTVGIAPVASTVAATPSAGLAASTNLAPVASPSASPGTNHVTLELTPIDAKVYNRGREVSGPPFEFDIENGERLALEVKRFGFATAKVVIDGKKPIVHFGMLHEHGPKPK